MGCQSCFCVVVVLRLVGEQGILTTWLLQCKMQLVNYYTARTDMGMTGEWNGVYNVSGQVIPCVLRGTLRRFESRRSRPNRGECGETSSLTSHLDVACVGCLGGTVRVHPLHYSCLLWVEEVNSEGIAAARLFLSNSEACHSFHFPAAWRKCGELKVVIAKPRGQRTGTHMLIESLPQASPRTVSDLYLHPSYFIWIYIYLSYPDNTQLTDMQ